MKILGFILLFLSSIATYSETINVGVIDFGPPFSSKADDGNHYYGFYIDLMDSICKHLNAECHYKPTALTNELKELKEGFTDVCFLPIPINSIPSKEFIYSLPYLASYGQFLTMKDSSINNLTDIKNINIGVLQATFYTSIMQSNFASI